MIKFKNIKLCKICNTEPIQKRKDTYGHGESYMEIWYQCPKCKYSTKSVGNYADYELVETTYKAVQAWNEFQEKLSGK